jgi:predicted ester cyclase
MPLLPLFFGVSEQPHLFLYNNRPILELGVFTIVEANKAVIRKLIETCNRRNLDVFDDLVSLDYFDHNHQRKGDEEFRQLFTLAFRGFPDWQSTIEDMIAAGEWFRVRVKATGMHIGEWNLFGVTLPPTNNKIKMPMIFYFRIVNGKLVEGSELDSKLDFFNIPGFIEYTEKMEVTA